MRVLICRGIVERFNQRNFFIGKGHNEAPSI